MKKFLIASVAILSTVIFTPSFAAGLKIGVIDMNQIMQKAPLMVSLNNDFVKKFKPRQDELIAAQKKAQDDANNLQMNGAMMSDADRTKLQNQVLADKADAQIMDASLSRDLAIAKDAAMKTFLAKFNDVITQIAQTEHYDMIQQSSGLAYVNKNMDITQEVLQKLQ